MSVSPPGPKGVPVDEFCHEALFYDGPESFVAGAIPFLREGIAAGEAILVVESAARIELLRAGLGQAADGVVFADMEEVGTNPARIIPAWQDFVAQHAGTGRRLRGIGEPIWNGRGPQELVECQQHESLLNVAFAGGEPWYLLCPYDTSSLPADVIEEALRSHPFLTEGTAHGRSPAYRGLTESAALLDVPLAEPQGLVHELDFAHDDLGLVRRVAARYATASGLSASRASGFVMAVNEVATSSVRDNGGTGKLRIWQEEDRVIGEIFDAGSFDRPLADRERPAPGSTGPRGLWFANQQCDLVQVRSVAAGTVVRLHMRRPSFRQMSA
ncbi:MAG TPA: sensor histidine kinase [Candidatus Dormibacteraeota bacterium]